MKSISVWMPRLPTIRVIGSHDISLTTTFCSVPGVSTCAMFAAPCVSNDGARRGYHRFW